MNLPADWGPLVSSQSKDMQVRLIGDSKLPVGVKPKLPVDVNVSVSACLSLYVGPVTDWQPVQVVPRRLPNANWDRLQLGSAPAPPRYR